MRTSLKDWMAIAAAAVVIVGGLVGGIVTLNSLQLEAAITPLEHTSVDNKAALGKVGEQLRGIDTKLIGVETRLTMLEERLATLEARHGTGQALPLPQH